MTTRHTLALALALLAVAAASNAPAKQFLKVSEVAARKAQLAGGNTAPPVDAIDTLQQQAQAQDLGIGYGDGMIPIQPTTPATDYSDLEAIQRQQQQETAALTQSIVNPQPRVVAPAPTEQKIGLAGSAIRPDPAPRPVAPRPVQVAATQPPKRTAAKPLTAPPARAPAAPKPARPRSVAAASPTPTPEAAPTPTAAQEAQMAESKRGLKAAEAKLRSVLSRFGRKKDKTAEAEPPTE